MQQLPVTWVDVFAPAPLQGNLLAVVADADAVDDPTMAVLAQRLRLSETSFLQAAPSPSATYRHRIWTVTGELPFAGHPSLGAAAAWCRWRGRGSAEVVQATPSGEQTLEVRLDAALDSGTVAVWPPAPTFGAEVDAGPLLAALGLPPGAAHPALPAQVVATGLATVLVPLAEPAALRDGVTVDLAALDRAVETVTGAHANCYVVAEEAPGHWSARCFTSDVVGGEDSATGSAVGPLGAYLAQRTGLSHADVDQGVPMGAPSRLVVDVDAAGAVRVSGAVQVVGEGWLRLPAAGPAPSGR